MQMVVRMESVGKQGPGEVTVCCKGRPLSTSQAKSNSAFLDRERQLQRVRGWLAARLRNVMATTSTQRAHNDKVRQH